MNELGRTARSRVRTLRERLVPARQRAFVGRLDELALFRAALEDPAPSFAVLHVHGPGGVGKTALLQAFADLAAECGVTPVLLDARDLEPSPQAFDAAVLAALGAAPGAALGAALGAAPGAALGEGNGATAVDALTGGRCALLIDTYEVLAALDDWLRTRFLPELPDGTVVVIAGRYPPAPAWREDAGWRGLLRVVPLRNLSPDEGRAYLACAGLPEDLHEQTLRVTHGHPLALSLVVDVLAQGASDASVDLARTPDVVHVLVNRFLEGVPGPLHRRALEVCAHARVTTEDLLSAPNRKYGHAPRVRLRLASLVRDECA